MGAWKIKNKARLPKTIGIIVSERKIKINFTTGKEVCIGRNEFKIEVIKTARIPAIIPATYGIPVEIKSSSAPAI